MLNRGTTGTPDTELIRTFVAVPVGEAAAREIERLLTRLSPLARLRWVTRMQLHITLKFLGEHTQDETERAQGALKALKEQLKGAAQFEIALEKVGGFPNLSRPNVLWLGATRGTQELSALAGRVEDALAAVGFPRERKPFQPHLTLARSRGERLPEKLEKALVEVPTFSWECSSESFCLMRSRLTPRGAVYTPIVL